MQRASIRRGLVISVVGSLVGIAALRSEGSQGAPGRPQFAFAGVGSLADVGATGDAPAPQALAVLPALVPTEPPVTGGDTAFAGQLDLGQMVLQGDHYEVPLPDGRRARLTIDPALQAEAEDILDDARAPRGAIIAMTPDGRLLAVYGRSATNEQGTEGAFDLAAATTVWAPAASVFKIVTAAALVDAGVDPSDKVCFHGGLRSVMESNLVDSKQDGRCETFMFGVAHSQNAIMGKLAYQHLSPEILASAAATMGFNGKPVPSALGGVAGTTELPTARDLDFARSAAGFRGSELSPLGGAMLAATIASGGVTPRPQVVDAILSGAGIEARVETVEPAPGRRVISEHTAHEVGRMLAETTLRGSARSSFRAPLPGGVHAAGKTGTLDRDAPTYAQYSWFVGYAPVDHPTIVVAVLLANRESWWLKGHQGARRMIERALSHHAPATTKNPS